MVSSKPSAIHITLLWSWATFLQIECYEHFAPNGVKTREAAARSIAKTDDCETNVLLI